MGRVFPLLYWFGLLLTLAGIVVRFWLGGLRSGLALALVGLALLLASRLAQMVRNTSRRSAARAARQQKH